MLLKSVFQNKITGPLLFFAGLILTLFVFSIHSNDFNIPLFYGVDNDIRLNIAPAETENAAKRGLLPDDTAMQNQVYINNAKLKPSINPPYNNFETYALDNYPVHKIEIKSKTPSKIVLAVGDKLFFDLKTGYITDKGPLHRFFISFLSIFYNPGFYILPFLFFGASFLSGFRPKINIWMILILALLLRLSDLSSCYWADELYTAYEAGNPALPFSAVFKDPGNPPLFFILSRIFISFFGYAPEITRILPLTFSLLSIYLIYIFMNKEKAGLLAAFMLAVNIYSLISSQELRSYSLCIFLVLALSIALFKKKYFLYGILAALAVNTHYFMGFILLSNFMWGIIFNEEKIKFFVSNIFAGFSFLPFLMLTGLNAGLNNAEFNVFPLQNINFYTDVVTKYGYGMLAPFIVLIFALKKPYPNKIYYYSIYTIFALFASSWLFAALIKPISRDHYHVILLPFFIIPLAMIPFLPVKKIISCGLLFMAFILPNSYVNRSRATLSSFDNLMELSYREKNPHYILVPYHKEMMERAFKKYLNEGDKILLHKLPLTCEEFSELSDGIYYLRVPKLELLNQLSKKYELSFVRCLKDVIIARVVIRN